MGYLLGSAFLVLFIGFAAGGCYLLAVNRFSFAVTEILLTAAGAMAVTLLIAFKSIILDAPDEFKSKTRVKNLETATGMYINIEAFLDTYPTKLFALDGLPYLSSLVPQLIVANLDENEKNIQFGYVFEAAFWRWFSDRYTYGWLVDDDLDTGFLGEKSGSRSYPRMEDMDLEMLDLRKLMVDSGSQNPWIVRENSPWIQNTKNWFGFKIPKSSNASYDPKDKTLSITGSSSIFKVRLTSGPAMLIKPLNNRSNFAEMLKDLIKARIRGIDNLQTHEIKMRTHAVEITQTFVPWKRYSKAAAIENRWAQTISSEVESAFGWPALYKALESAINERVLPYIPEWTL